MDVKWTISANGNLNVKLYKFLLKSNILDVYLPFVTTIKFGKQKIQDIECYNKMFSTTFVFRIFF